MCLVDCFNLIERRVAAQNNKLAPTRIAPGRISKTTTLRLDNVRKEHPSSTYYTYTSRVFALKRIVTIWRSARALSLKRLAASCSKQ